MKLIRITSTAILSLVLGIAAPAYAQEQNEKQDHPAQQESKQGKPEQHHSQQQQHAQQQQKQDQNKQQHHAQQEQQNQNKQEQHAQQQQSNQRAQRSQEQERVQQSAWQKHGSRNWESEHRTWQQRGGYHGYRIPDNRYNGYFGSNHGFRIYGLPFMVVSGYPRFQYEGYWFSPVDPWPTYWGNNWYDTDEVYVVYVNNGYYMYNSRYPTSGIAISISM
jgi:flagellar motor protein MotB